MIPYIDHTFSSPPKHMRHHSASLGLIPSIWISRSVFRLDYCLPSLNNRGPESVLPHRPSSWSSGHISPNPLFKHIRRATQDSWNAVSTEDRAVLSGQSLHTSNILIDTYTSSTFSATPYTPMRRHISSPYRHNRYRLTVALFCPILVLPSQRIDWTWFAVSPDRVSLLSTCRLPGCHFAR